MPLVSRLKTTIARTARCTMTRISPKLNTKVLYRRRFSKPLDLDNPVTLNEKILWLKFNSYWNNPLVVKCADKLAVREFIVEKGFESILNDLLEVYKSPEEIDWDELPERFALKLNTGSGSNLIVHDKNSLDIGWAKREMRRWMKEKYWLEHSEMQYKDVPKRILLEKYLGDGENLPEDYKFYCMNGLANYVLVCVGRGNAEKPQFYFFNREWELQPLTRDALAHPGFKMAKPEGIDFAFECASRLAEGFPFVRCDLYIVDGRVFFGELTFTPSAGMDTGRLPETDLFFGNQLDLSEEMARYPN